MRTTTRRSSVGIPHLYCPVEEGSNPEGDRDPLNVPKTPFMRERERVGHKGRWKEREREREGRREREREQERGTQSKSRGLTGAEGGWWVRADQGYGKPWQHRAV